MEISKGQWGQNLDQFNMHLLLWSCYCIFKLVKISFLIHSRLVGNKMFGSHFRTPFLYIRQEISSFSFPVYLILWEIACLISYHYGTFLNYRNCFEIYWQFFFLILISVCTVISSQISHPVHTLPHRRVSKNCYWTGVHTFSLKMGVHTLNTHFLLTLFHCNVGTVNVLQTDMKYVMVMYI